TRADRRENFEAHVAELFASNGILLRKLPEAELHLRVRRTQAAKFTRLCMSFIQRAKKLRKTPDEITRMIEDFDFESEKERIFCSI
mgnify:CR=1